MIVVGVTGSLATGKSETAGFFRKHGARVFDADKAAMRVVQKGRPLCRAIAKTFGEEFLSRGGELDRQKLADHVFSHPKDLKKLNILVHPAVIMECAGIIRRLHRTKDILVLDVPLLFESRMHTLADLTVVVSAKKSKLIRRAAKKGIGPALAKKILASQWPLAKKERLADIVIHNDGTLEDLERKVLAVLGDLRRRMNKKGEK